MTNKKEPKTFELYNLPDFLQIFYEELLESQESLGPEFEKVWVENMEKLYED